MKEIHMTSKLTYKSYVLLILPLGLILSLYFFTKSAFFNAAPTALGIGVLIDLTVSIPLLYFFIIRNTKIPNFTTLHVFLLGLFIAGWILPAEQQLLVKSLKSIAFPTLELGILGLITYKLLSLKKNFNSTNTGTDFYDRLQLAVGSVFKGRLKYFIATEIAVCYYLFVRKPKQKIAANTYTYYKKSGIKTMLFGFIFLLVIETFVLHILLGLWNETVAWILTALSLYTICQVIAIIQSMNHRFIYINNLKNQLELKYGFASQTIIPFTAIERIEKLNKIPVKDSTIHLSPFQMIDSTNLVIHVSKPLSIDRLYGIQKTYSSIGLWVDDRDTFVQQINSLQP